MVKQATKKITGDKNSVITVKNADGEPNTKANILIQNKINYVPKVSVIIPVYNVEQYLCECLDSVINQTLKEIEIICVDDGSTDNSLNILKKYAKKDHRITIITQENLHAGVARNAGLSVAKGEYVHFCDSDDAVDETMYNKMYYKAKKYKSDICVCSADFYKNDGSFMSYKNSLKYNLLDDKEIFSIKDTNVFDVVTVGVWNKIYRKKFLNDNNLRYQNIFCCNDVYFSKMTLFLAKKINWLADVFYHYRQEAQSNITSKRGKFWVNIFIANDKIKQHLLQLNMFNSFSSYYFLSAAKNYEYEYKKCNIKYKDNMLKAILSRLPEKIFLEYFPGPHDFTINLAYAFDDKFALLVLTSIQSVINNVKYGEHINFILMYDKINKRYKKIIQRIIVASGHTITWLHINSKRFKDFPCSSWVTYAAWFRCLLPDLLPDLDRILYLDSDTLVRHSLVDLFYTDLQGATVGVIEDVSDSKKAATRLNLKDNLYFNSGVMLIDCNKWRENNTFNKIEKFVIDNKDKIVSSDQDTLNSVLDGKKHRLSPIYDYMEVWWRKNNCDYTGEYKNDYEYAKTDATIVHFTGVKPIDVSCKNSYKTDFYKYAHFVPNYKVVYPKKLENEISGTAIPVVFASDENYLKYTYVTMLSCIRNTKSFIDFYIMIPRNLKTNKLKFFTKLELYGNCKINIIKIGDTFDNCKLSISHITKPTYYRLVMADVLPKYYDKCIYLDADVIVNGDIKEFFDISLDDNFIGGVKAASYHMGHSYAEKIQIPSIDTYINAGVTLWNLKKIREQNKVPELIKLSQKNYQSQDQDVINVAFFGHIKLLSLKYNFMTKYPGLFDDTIPQYKQLCDIYGKRDVEISKKSFLIIHYADKIKPWDNRNVPLADLWYKYANKVLSMAKKTGNTKSYILFPYYLFAVIWMKVIYIPLLKFVKHTKNVLYSHSYRGRMKALKTEFNDVNKNLYYLKINIAKQTEILNVMQEKIDKLSECKNKKKV